MRKSLSLFLPAAMALLAAGSARAEDASPIFGHAAVQPTTVSQNKSVVGKGYYADLYGYYGNYYSGLASSYGNMGLYFKYSGYYASASSYAASASTYYSYAAYDQAYGF